MLLAMLMLPAGEFKMLHKEAPHFSLESSIGQSISTNDLLGAFTVLIFYPANDSPTCNKQLSEVNLDLNSFLALNARVFGVNTADKEKQQQYCLRRRLEFPILSDPGGKVARRYGASFFGLPIIKRTVVIIDPSGWIMFYERGTPAPAKLLESIQRIANLSGTGADAGA